MDLILLGGNSVLNKSWIEEIAQNLGDLFKNTYIQYYKHWEEKGLDTDSWLMNFSYPALVIQNKLDPVCSYNKLASFISKKKITGFTLVETQGNTHHYPDLLKIHLEIEKYIKRLQPTESAS